MRLDQACGARNWQLVTKTFQLFCPKNIKTNPWSTKFFRNKRIGMIPRAGIRDSFPSKRWTNEIHYLSFIVSDSMISAMISVHIIVSFMSKRKCWSSERKWFAPLLVRLETSSIFFPTEHLWWSFYCENSKPVSIFTKKFHRRCWLGF